VCGSLPVAHERAWIGKQDVGSSKSNSSSTESEDKEVGGFDLQLYMTVCKQKPVISYIILNILLGYVRVHMTHTRIPH
jgi:hypothetical protein